MSAGAFAASMRKLIEEKAAEQQRKMGGEGEGEAGSGSRTSAPPITIDIMATGSRITQLRRKFTQTDTVRVIKQAVKDEINHKADWSTHSLFLSSKALKDDQVLKDIPMECGGFYTLMYLVKLKGGASLPSSGTLLPRPAPCVHVFNAKMHPTLRISKKADDLLCTDDDFNPRVVAPCGKHCFTSETYFQLMSMVIDKNEYETKLICPMSDCTTEISFDFVRKAAMLNEEEIKWFSWHIAMRGVKGTFKACPGCDRLCQRPDDLNYVRVSCAQGCRDFCFQCGQIWRESGFQVCGNTRCLTYFARKMIAEAEIIGLYSGSDDRKHRCPKLRACPKCMAVIEWQEMCKHFTCYACGHEFCFLCLKPQEGEGGCVSYDYKIDCGAAPRQVLK